MGSGLNYAVQQGWLTIRPGLQYKWHPSGENEIPNALVLDLETTIKFLSLALASPTDESLAHVSALVWLHMVKFH